jgi:hypothetical protein
MHHDGANSARARSARIRSAHDGEADQLETMRRNAMALRERRRARVSLVSRLASALGRSRRLDVDTET